MNISYGVPIMAPQTTGHPAALPADPPAARPDTTIAAVSAQSGAEGAQSRSAEGQDTAPPSALQRKIMEILERQAAEIEQA